MSNLIWVPPQPHGGPNGAPVGDRLVIHDFSVNTNPFGPSPSLRESIANAEIDIYPNPGLQQLKTIAAGALNTESECIAFGSGSSELIYRVMRTILKSGDPMVIAAPTFGEYQRAARIIGALPIEVDVYKDGEANVNKLCEAIEQAAPKLIVICHPNNPTGTAWKEADLEQIAECSAAVGGYLCIDTAYLEATRGVAKVLPKSALVLQSPTKTHAIPGIRLGWLTGPAEIIQQVENAGHPWILGAIEVAAAGWVFGDEARAFLKRTVPQWFEASAMLSNAIKELGFHVSPSETPFFLVDIPGAFEWSRRAMESGFRLRHCEDFGLTHTVRISPQSKEANEKLLAWWRVQ